MQAALSFAEGLIGIRRSFSRLLRATCVCVGGVYKAGALSG